MISSFKLLITDLDGTAIPNKEDGTPSQRVIDAIKSAQKIVPISVATGRPISNSRHILKTFEIKSPCIISGGSQIIDPVTEKILWEKTLSKFQLNELITVCMPYSSILLFDDELLTDPNALPAKDKKTDSVQHVAYLIGVKNELVDEIMQKIKSIPEVSAQLARSWTESELDIHVTHREATKEHALEKLMEMMNVSKEETICVGDGDNDLPLFRAVGYKVAMGNATENLKKEADYITGSVDDDGLAQVIEEKILSS